MKTTILCLLMACLVGGCAMLKHTDKDGNETIYLRAGNQTIGTGSIDLPGGGKLTFEGQKSELPPVRITTEGIFIGKEMP